jgi:hypothetical protein
MKITIGTKFHSSYCDANPEWTVTSQRGGDTWNCTVTNCTDYIGSKKVFGGEEIRASIQMAKFWSKTADESENFYKNLAVGAIVHYSNGFGQFVRCQVNKDKKLVSIALVGDWREYDLPRRRANGEIDLPYHVKKLIEKEPYTPHASNIYEFSSSLQKQYANPINLKPIDLNVPEMTPGQTETARLWKKIEQIENIIRARGENPQLILEQVYGELVKG